MQVFIPTDVAKHATNKYLGVLVAAIYDQRGWIEHRRRHILGRGTQGPPGFTPVAARSTLAGRDLF